MKNGIYKVFFDSNVNRNGTCDGIVSVRDGHVNGGDYVCYYKGNLEGNKLTLNVVRHNPNDTTVFNGVDDVVLELTISEMHDGGVFDGKVKNMPQVSITGSMLFLSDIA